jgi:hypothetical protein
VHINPRCVAVLAAALLLTSPIASQAQVAPASPAPAAIAQSTTPVPTPTPNPLTLSGRFRSYYFTRQNASNNPGVQNVFIPASPKPKYNTNAVNQASWNNAIDLHAQYNFAGGGWFVGATYLYANPIDGPCTTAQSHAKSATYPKPNCTSQVPPGTDPDDTLPGFAMSTFYEAYVGYKAHNFYAKVGDQLFNSPWAAPVDTRIKPAAFQGGDFIYTTNQNFVYEAADMLQFEPRTSSAFISGTLLTSYPAGNNGMAPNIVVNGKGGINTPGFLYTHVGYDPKTTEYANVYMWNVTDLLNIYWLDGRYTWDKVKYHPYVGKIDAQLFGIQLGGNITKNIVLSGSFVDQPWHYDNVFLPAGVTCSNTSHQITTKGVNFAYFLPLNAAQCHTNANGTTQIAYGGWASPYTDNYATNPIFTTASSPGTRDRRAAATSWRAAATYTSTNNRFIFIAGDAWYNYGNSIAAQNTNEWNLDGTYRFSPVHGTAPYHGLQLRYRYAQRTYSNSYCGATNTSCPNVDATGTTILGGQPLFKYNRAMLEYDF